MVVARVRLNWVNTFAYEQCFHVLFEVVKEDHPKIGVGEFAWDCHWLVRPAVQWAGECSL